MGLLDGGGPSHSPDVVFILPHREVDLNQKKLGANTLLKNLTS